MTSPMCPCIITSLQHAMNELVMIAETAKKKTIIKTSPHIHIRSAQTKNNAGLHSPKKKKNKERIIPLQRKCPDTVSSMIHLSLTSQSRRSDLLILAEPALEPALLLVCLLLTS